MKFSEVYNCAPTIGVLIYMHAHSNWEGNIRNVRVLIESKRFLLLFPQAKALWGVFISTVKIASRHIRWIIQVSVEYQPRNYSRCCKEDGSSD